MTRLVGMLGIAIFVSRSAQPPVFRSDAVLVPVTVTVTAADGRRVQGLNRNSFAITGDGLPRPITQFSSEPLPLSVALALDTSTSMSGQRFDDAREAVWHVLADLTPDDEACVYGFSDRPYIIANWTTSKNELIMKVSAAFPMRRGGGTALYLTIGSAVDDLRRAPRGRRRAVIVITDGNDEDAADEPASSRQRRRVAAVQRIQQEETLVYPIGIGSATAAGSVYDELLDVSALRELAEVTGAHATVVHSSRDIASAADGILGELREQYELGFVPLHVRDGKFHRITVTVPGCTCHVQARAGFVPR